MDWLTGAFQNLPAAATSPLALVAYLMAVGGGVLLSFQLNRNASAQRALDSLPEKNRQARAREIIGRPIPSHITADEWLRHQRLAFLLAALGILCLTAVAVFAISVWRPPPTSPAEKNSSGQAAQTTANSEAGGPPASSELAPVLDDPIAAKSGARTKSAEVPAGEISKATEAVPPKKPSLCEKYKTKTRLEWRQKYLNDVYEFPTYYVGIEVLQWNTTEAQRDEILAFWRKAYPQVDFEIGIFFGQSGLEDTEKWVTKIATGLTEERAEEVKKFVQTCLKGRDFAFVAKRVP